MGRQHESEIFASERRAFSAYLRTGGPPPARPLGGIELKFNPNHDPANGQFTTGPGGSAAAARTRQGSTGRTRYGANDPRHPHNYTIHVAKRGDTLDAVAKLRKGVRASDLAWLNNLPPDHVLAAGEQLKLPNQSYLDAGREAKNTAVALDYYIQTHGGRLPPDVAHPPSLEAQILGPAQWHHVEAKGYDFGIDARQVTGVLASNPDQGRSRSAQRAAGGSDRLLSDDGGHYIARRFNGPTEAFNHFAQDSSFNRGDYKRLEGTWAKAQAEHKIVWVKIRRNMSICRNGHIRLW